MSNAIEFVSEYWEAGSDRDSNILAAFTLADAAYTYNGYRVATYTPSVLLGYPNDIESVRAVYGDTIETDMIVDIHTELDRGEIDMNDIEGAVAELIIEFPEE